jgi:hypothetical protein
MELNEFRNLIINDKVRTVCGIGIINRKNANQVRLTFPYPPENNEQARARIDCCVWFGKEEIELVERYLDTID